MLRTAFLLFQPENRKKLKLGYINPLVSNAPFLYPLKTTENRKDFFVFREQYTPYWEQMGYIKRRI